MAACGPALLRERKGVEAASIASGARRRSSARSVRFAVLLRPALQQHQLEIARLGPVTTMCLARCSSAVSVSAPSSLLCDKSSAVIIGSAVVAPRKSAAAAQVYAPLQGESVLWSARLLAKGLRRDQPGAGPSDTVDGGASSPPKIGFGFQSAAGNSALGDSAASEVRALRQRKADQRAR